MDKCVPFAFIQNLLKYTYLPATTKYKCNITLQLNCVNETFFVMEILLHQIFIITIVFSEGSKIVLYGFCKMQLFGCSGYVNYIGWELLYILVKYNRKESKYYECSNRYLYNFL